MNIDLLRRQRVEINNQHQYEQFEVYQQARRRTDEVTDAAERLNAPMRSTFEYELRPDGELCFQGQPLGEVFDAGIVVAEELTKQQPHFMIELMRRRLERNEYDEMRRLALGSPRDPDVLVVVSPIPDAVVDGLELNAYDLDRKKTMVRIFERTTGGIQATSLSLDRTDHEGLQRIASYLGQTIDDHATSEDILAMRFHAYQSRFDGALGGTLRALYDDVLSTKFGGDWYAGRQDSPVQNSLKFIETQPDIITTHMAVITRIMKASNSKEQGRLLEDARYNFAAALTRRVHGEQGSVDLSSAGSDARSNGEKYANDCPTNVTAQQSLQMLGVNEKKTFMSKSCPICGEKNVVTKVLGEKISGSCGCERLICSGEVKHGQKGRFAEVATDTHPVKSKEIKQTTEAELLRVQYGQYAEIKTVMQIGGTAMMIIDRRSGEQIT